MDTPGADAQPQLQHADVYERLYDVRSYTGVYRKRFELDIHDLTDTVVHDLAGTVRPNLNHDIENRARRPTLSPRLSSSSLSAAAAAAAMAIDTHASRQSPERPAPCPSPIRLEGDPNDPHTLLRAIFHYYCRFGRTGAKGANETSMDNANFSKLCRECPELLDASFTRTDVDLIFVKAKKKGERRVNYTRFLDALGMIAIQKYPDLSLEASVPMLLQVHISKLPCIVEFADGKQVQAVWSRRLDRTDSQSSTSSSAPPSPPSRRSSTPHASPPKAIMTLTTMPPPAPLRSPRMYRRPSSPPSPPPSVLVNCELRRHTSEDDASRRASASAPEAPADSSSSPRRVPTSSSTIHETRQDEEEEEEESLCYAS